MAQDFLSGPLAQPFLAPLSLLPDGEPVRVLVLAVVLNRACLLAELPEASLARFSGQRSILLDCLNSAVLRARASVGLSSDPRRFLPESAFSLLGRTDVPWKEITRLSRPFFWSWPEVIAARGPVCAFGLGLALEMIYSPGQFSKLPGGTFEERCIHSGCSHLILRIDLASGGKDPPVWEGLPRARIALSGLALSSSSSSLSINPILWRFPAHLALEHGVRVMAGSVIKSWKSYRSGLWAWGTFVQTSFEFRQHFEVDLTMLSAFSAMFSNGATFSHYVGHLRFGMRLLGISWAVDPSISAALFRGARKFHVRADLPRLLQKDVLALVVKALRSGNIEVARLMVVARAFLFRVENECFPLQSDGRGSLPFESRAWHSVITVFKTGVEIQLRSRKNAPDGDLLRRQCTCSKIPLLCGPCALKAQVLVRKEQGVAASSPIFTQSSSSALRLIREWCVELSIERPGWHSFRRGMASDLLTSGQIISVILRAGGWKSAAFLNYLRLRDVDEREALDFTMDLSDQE